MTTANWIDFNELDSTTWPEHYQQVLVVFDGCLSLGYLCQPYAQFGNNTSEWSIDGECETIIDLSTVKYWADAPKLP